MGFLNSIITTIQWTFWALMPNQWRPHMVVPHAKTMVEGKVGGITFEKFACRLRWVVHIIIVVLIVVALWYINWRFDLEKVLHSPWPILHQVWLPLLFLLIYALCWLGWWLWRLLSPDAASDQFPDIDAAWTEALTALSKAGIDPAEVPLVLVLGRPARSMEDLFAAAQLTLPVRHVPRAPDAPVRVYASREAVFVTCEGASLLSRQAELLAGTPAVAPAPGAAATANGAAAAPGTDPAAATGLELNADDLDEPGSAPAQTAAQPTAAATAAAAPGLGDDLDPLFGEESQSAGVLVADPEEAEAQAAPGRRPMLLRNLDEVERHTARLKHLCRLIARRRHPYCGVNGVLVLVPLAATDSDTDANQTGAVCNHDLAAVRDALHVHCPVFAMVCDLEKAPGFRELIRYFPEGKQRHRFVGRHFPLLPQLEPSVVPMMIESGVRWLCQTLFPTLVYRLVRLEGAEEEPATAVRHNARLFQFLGQLRERQGRLSRLLARGFLVEAGRPLLFGGCYLAATGGDVASEQAFVHGVLRLLIDNQNYVSWTREAQAEEADYRRLTIIGWVIVAILAAALGLLVYRLWLPH